jgi:hypothetical protein
MEELAVLEKAIEFEVTPDAISEVELLVRLEAFPVLVLFCSPKVSPEVEGVSVTDALPSLDDRSVVDSVCGCPEVSF